MYRFSVPFFVSEIVFIYALGCIYFYLYLCTAYSFNGLWTLKHDPSWSILTNIFWNIFCAEVVPMMRLIFFRPLSRWRGACWLRRTLRLWDRAFGRSRLWFAFFQRWRSCRMYCLGRQEETMAWTSASLTFTPGKLFVTFMRSSSVRFFRLLQRETLISQWFTPSNKVCLH